jgi:hypothetical protein
VIQQFTLWCKNEGDADDTAWPEPYTKDVRDPQKWGEQTIAKFNDTLHPGERARVLVRVEVAPNKTKLSHDWRKTNAVTVMRGSRVYDTYRCHRCGGTGKRHGLEHGVKPDKGTLGWCKVPAQNAKARA